MLATLQDAKTQLETEGLYVSNTNSNALWIAADVRDVGTGIRMSNNACSLLRDADRWVAVFPATGLLTYEMPGTLSELIDVIVSVFEQHHRAGGRLNDAFQQVVRESQQYLIGRSLAGA